MDNKAILCVIAVFFAVGGIDHLIGNRLGLGSVFLETLQKMGMILLGVMGIYSLAPVAAEYVGAAVTPLADALHMDPSVFPAMLFPVDMGGFQLAVETAKDPRMGLVSGALIASLCGATVGYTITVASTVMDKRFFPQLARGILSGMAGIPVGCVVGAVLAGVPLPAALYNCLPLWVLAGLLMWGLLCAPEKMTKGFTVFGRILSAIAVVGLILQAVQMLTGWTILPGMASAQEGLRLVGTIIFIMTGAMCLLTVLSRVLRRPLRFVARKMGIGGEAVTGILSAAVSVTLTFTQVEKMDERGLIVVCAFCATGAHVIGGQLGVVADLAPEMVGPFLAAKAVAGAVGIALALVLARNRQNAAQA